MKHLFFLLILSVLCFSCTIDNGTPTTQSFAIDGNFTALDVSHGFQVTVSDKVSDVEVTVGENVLDKVVVNVKNGNLQIGFKRGTLYSGRPTAVIPSNANLDEIELSGASSFNGNLKGVDVDIELSGGSVFTGSVETNFLDIELSGASVANIVGYCQETMHIDLSGASDLRAANFPTLSVKGSMSGSSYADVTCCSSLKVDLSGASHLTYGTVDSDCNVLVKCNSTGGSTVDRWSPNKSF